MARALWLPGAEKSSVKVPPTPAARKSTATSVNAQLARVRQGCLALAIATARVNRFMVVPFEEGLDAGCIAKLRTDQVRGRHHIW
jgi:hypothetical protein